MQINTVRVATLPKAGDTFARSLIALSLGQTCIEGAACDGTGFGTGVTGGGHRSWAGERMRLAAMQQP